MEISISNHPQLKEIQRTFEFANLETDLQNFAKLKGFVKFYVNNEKELVTPIGFNPNGEYKELLADNTILVNSETGEYSQEGDTTEIDYLKNMPISVIANAINKEVNELNVNDILGYLIEASVQKQDLYKRFDK